MGVASIVIRWAVKAVKGEKTECEQKFSFPSYIGLAE